MKADSGDAAKTPRRKRHDPAQSKPKFSELTALWFGDAPESKWNATKAKFGYYLHPQLVSLISVLSIPKALRPMEVSKEWVSQCLDLYAVYQRHSGLSLQEGLLAALLAGDTIFFDHLALTLRSLQSDERANTEYLCVTKAYAKIMERRAIRAWKDRQIESGKTEIGKLPGLMRANIFARAKGSKYKGLNLPKPCEVLAEILIKAEFREHRQYWVEADHDAKLSTVRKHLRSAGLKYSDDRKASARRTKR
jgi:hypothetical protein